MDIGMLWHDDDKKTDLAAKLERAVEFYRSKYGASPNEVHVHPSQKPSESIVAGMLVHGSRTVHKNHFWLGVAEAKPK